MPPQPGLPNPDDDPITAVRPADRARLRRAFLLVLLLCRLHRDEGPGEVHSNAKDSRTVKARGRMKM